MNDTALLLLIEVVKVVGISLGGLFAFLAYRRSMANSVIVQDIKKATDGITTARVEAETKLGEARAEVERGAGRDEERAKGEQRAAAIAEGQRMTVAPLGPIEVEVVKTAPVAVKSSVPIEIDKGN